MVVTLNYPQTQGLCTADLYGTKTLQKGFNLYETEEISYSRYITNSVSFSLRVRISHFSITLIL